MKAFQEFAAKAAVAVISAGIEHRIATDVQLCHIDDWHGLTVWIGARIYSINSIDSAEKQQDWLDGVLSDIELAAVCAEAEKVAA